MGTTAVASVQYRAGASCCSRAAAVSGKGLGAAWQAAAVALAGCGLLRLAG